MYFFTTYFNTVENWLPVIVASLVGLVVGFLWYNPKVFGKTWMDAMGFKEEDSKSANMPLIYILSLILSLFLALFLRKMVAHGEADSITFQHGLYHTLSPIIFVVAPIVIINCLFERRSLAYTLISFGYWAVTFLIMGGILSMWR